MLPLISEIALTNEYHENCRYTIECLLPDIDYVLYDKNNSVKMTKVKICPKCGKYNIKRHGKKVDIPINVETINKYSITLDNKITKEHKRIYKLRLENGNVVGNNYCTHKIYKIYNNSNKICVKTNVYKISDNKINDILPLFHNAIMNKEIIGHDSTCLKIIERKQIDIDNNCYKYRNEYTEDIVKNCPNCNSTNLEWSKNNWNDDKGSQSWYDYNCKDCNHIIYTCTDLTRT